MAVLVLWMHALARQLLPFAILREKITAGKGETAALRRTFKINLKNKAYNEISMFLSSCTI